MEDVLDDPGYRNLSYINRSVWIDILATFNRQQAHRTGNTIVLNWPRARALFASPSDRGVLTRVRTLSRNVGLGGAIVPEGLLVFIPKWAKLQGLTPTRLRCISDATPATTTTTTTTNPHSPPLGVKKPRANPKPRTEKKPPATPFPEDTTELEARIRDWIRRKHPELSHRSVPRGLERIGLWAGSKNKRMDSWYKAVQGYFLDGWPWEGQYGPGAPDPPRQASARRGYHKPVDLTKRDELIRLDFDQLKKRTGGQDGT